MDLEGAVAAFDQPFVILLGKQRAGEADDLSVVGEDPGDSQSTRSPD
jgi:hypothetical protein